MRFLMPDKAARTNESILRDAHERAAFLGVPKDLAAVPRCSEQEFKRAKNHSKGLFVYSDYLLNLFSKLTAGRTMGCLLLDKDNLVLKIYGSQPWKKMIGEYSLGAKCRLSEETAGTTAVSLAQRYHQPCLTMKEDHYCSLFQNLFILHAPGFYSDPNEPEKETYLGGITIVGKPDGKEYEYLMLASAWMWSVNYNFNLANGFLFITDGLLGRATVNYYRGIPSVISSNKRILEILGLSQEEDIRFKQVSRVFDPLPRNAAFWDIIESKRSVQEQDITLSVYGRTGNYTITTLFECQKAIGYETMVIFLGSAQGISSFISEKTGNSARFAFSDIIGKSPAIAETINRAVHYAHSDSNILITGESGTGKDLFAQAIHNGSRRRNKSFVAVNCAALPRDLIASELFGYEYGAFSGAKKNGYRGKFELANGGTLFLDEIGDMPLDLQAVLLRAVEEKQFTKLGSTEPIQTDVRIICATNANLQKKISQNLFREDLYYRISSLKLNIPPLRERGNDIILLANAFISSVCIRADIPEKRLSSEADELLMRLTWKGNIRELQNAVESIVQLYPGRVISAEHISDYLSMSNSTLGYDEVLSLQFETEAVLPPEPFSQPGAKKPAVTRNALIDALKHTHYNKSTAAEELGISRKTLYKWIRLYGIEI